MPCWDKRFLNRSTSWLRAARQGLIVFSTLNLSSIDHHQLMNRKDSGFCSSGNALVVKSESTLQENE